jgi:hypothetical protein
VRIQSDPVTVNSYVLFKMSLGNWEGERNTSYESGNLLNRSTKISFQGKGKLVTLTVLILRRLNQTRDQ